MTDPDDVDREERYRALLRTVEHNTGGPQPPAATEHVITGILCQSKYTPKGVRTVITAAVEHGDLIRFEGPDGRRRLARTTEDTLRAVAVWAADRPDPVKHIVAKANRAMA